MNNMYDILGKFRLMEGRAPAKTLAEGFSPSEEVADMIEKSMGGAGRLTSDDLYRAVTEYQSMMDSPHKLDVDEVVQILMDRLHSKGIMVPDVNEKVEIFHKPGPGADSERYSKDPSNPAAVASRKAAADAAKKLRASGDLKGTQMGKTAATDKGSAVKAVSTASQGFKKGSGMVEAKPDFLDLDKDGNTKEPMKKAARDAKVQEAKPEQQRMFGTSMEELLKKHGRDVKQFQSSGKLSDRLYSALYDYFTRDTGPDSMPYGTAKARTDDPYNWIAGKLAKKLGMNEADLDEVSRGEYIKQQDAKAERSGKKKFKAFGQDFSTDEVKENDVAEGIDNDLSYDWYVEAIDYLTPHKLKMQDPKVLERVAKQIQKEILRVGKEDSASYKFSPAMFKRAYREVYNFNKDIDEGQDDMMSDADRGEYDYEGDMAKDQLRTIEAAAEQLKSILSDEENLPEWVQQKITLAADYVDTARDYMLAKHDEHGEEHLDEKAVSVKQRRAAGIARAAQKGEIPKSKLRGASKEMAKMSKDELHKFAATKEKGLPEKKGKKKTKEEVEETTVAGSVATAPAAAPKKKKGAIQFGKGIYENQLRESFDAKLNSVLAEGMIDSLKSIVPKAIQMLGGDTVKQIATKVKNITGGDYTPSQENAVKVAKAFGFDKQDQVSEGLAGNWQGKLLQAVHALGVASPFIGQAAGVKGFGGPGEWLFVIGVLLLMVTKTFWSSEPGHIGAMGKYGNKGLETHKGPELNEGMSMNLSVGEDGKKNLTLTATDEDADRLAQIIRLAGMDQARGYQPACEACGQAECGCEAVSEGDYGNSPEVVTANSDMMVNGLSGGLNGPKQQSNPNNPGDNPIAMPRLGQHSSPNLNLGIQKDEQEINEEVENRLRELYKRYRV